MILQAIVRIKLGGSKVKTSIAGVEMCILFPGNPASMVKGVYECGEASAYGEEMHALCRLLVLNSQARWSRWRCRR